MEWGQLWQVLPACQSVYLFEFIKEPVHIPAIPFEKPSQLLCRDQKRSHRYLIPDRLRLKADVGRKFFDIHHPFFHGATSQNSPSTYITSGKRLRGTNLCKNIFLCHIK